MGNFNEQISRMKNLMTYGSVNESKEEHSGSMEYHAIAADGKSYGIIRENAKFYIKVAPQSKEKIAEAYEYIGGFRNRKDNEYTSYSNALKQFELKMMSLNEAYSARVNVETLDPFKKEDVIIEGTQKMKDEIARQRQIMNNASALMNESSTIKVGNTGNPEAPKTSSFSDGIGEPFNEKATATLDKDMKKTAKKPAKMGKPFGKEGKAEESKDAEYVPTGSVANQKPKGGKVAKVNEDCEKDEWGSCGVPETGKIGSPDGHLMEDDDIAGIADDNFEANDDEMEDVENVDAEELDDLGDEDIDSEEDFDDEMEDEEPEEGDEEHFDDDEESDEDDLDDDDMDFDEDFEDGEELSDEEMSDLDDEDLEDEEEDSEKFDDKEFDDEEMDSEEGEEFDGEDVEEEFDPEKDAQYDDFDFDAADSEELEDEGDFDDFDDEESDELEDDEEDDEFSEDDFDDDEDLEGEDEFDDDEESDEEDLDDMDSEEDDEDDSEESDEEDLDDMDSEEDDEFDDDFGISESRKKQLQPIVESLVKTLKKTKVNEEGTKLNDFGKHPGYRKKPMTLPQTGSDKEGQNRDWNDESVHNEQPFGQKIGSSAPFDDMVEKITNSVMERIMGKKKI